MVEDSEVANALFSIEHMEQADSLVVAILTHVVHTVKDDICVTNLYADSRTRILSVRAESDHRDEEFEVEFTRDNLMQTILTFSRTCWRYGKADSHYVRKFQINNPAFTPDTLVEQMRRFYPH